MDPFCSVQTEVRDTLAEIQADLSKWQKLPAKSAKAEHLRQRILSTLSELQVDLQDMQSTIDIALKDPAKFALTPSELMARQEFVRDLQARTNDARDVLESPPQPSRGLARTTTTNQRVDRQTLLMSNSRTSDHGCNATCNDGHCGGDAAQYSGAARQDNENACLAAQMEQTQSLENQQAHLSTIGQSVDRLGQMGRVINEELRTQGRELDAFTDQVDGVSDKMTAATKAMKKMLKRKDRGKLCAILVLTVILLLLMYAVLSW